MPFREKRILSGEILEVEVYPISKDEIRKPRSKRMKETRKEQKRLNKENAKKHFKRLIYANFSNKAIVVTLTYEKLIKPKNEINVTKDFQNFVRRLKYILKKETGDDLKYLSVIEDGEDGKNYHIHAILECVSGILELKKVEKTWGKGFTNMNRLRTHPDDVEGLAEYFLENPKGKKKWMQSKGLVIPEPKVNDTKYRSRKDIRELSNAVFDREEIEKRYPGYEYIRGNSETNLIYGGDYITILMRRRC